MLNNTICIPKKVRLALGILPKDKLLVILKGGFMQIKKYDPVTLNDLVGVGKKVYKLYGGGEAYLKNERKSWKE